MAKTKVSFINHKYGNYQDNWYTDNYEALITTLESQVQFTAEVNLGVSDGVILENNFSGDFQAINCAIVDHDLYGKHLYKLIKKSFIRRNLWRITMVKDMVSSRYSDLLNSKVLVSRLGISRSEFDPLLFQPEVLDLSEVKKQQILLQEFQMNKSYGFLAIWARDSLDGTNIVWNSSPREIYAADYTVTNSLTEFEGYGKKQRRTYNRYASFNVNDGVSYNGHSVSASHGTSVYQANMQPLYSQAQFNYEQYQYDTSIFTAYRLRTLCGSYFPLSTEDISKYIGKVVFISQTGQYYEIVRSAEKTRTEDRDITTQEMQNILQGTSALTTNTTRKIYYEETYTEIDFVLLHEVPVVNKTLNAYVNTVDQPFQMFYIPIIEGATVTYNSETYVLDKTITEAMLYDLIGAYSGTAGKLLDVQVIPYSPVEGFNSMYNQLSNTLDVSEAIDVIPVGDVIVPLYEVMYCNYQLTISYNRTVSDYKVEQKRKYLLTSPSGATVYDFSLARNQGIEGFNIEVDLRPYATFHRVQPIFKGLYGTNFKDTRGLIWQEDTSLTMTSSAWETYKRQNINYLNTFNTEQNYKRSELAIQQQANWGNYGFDAGKRLIEASVDAASFAAEAVANDVWFGAKGAVSGGAGAAAIMGGAIATEAIEAGQLAYNNRMDKKLVENEISVARQQFNYNIGNIKAIPENLEKVNGVFNTNNLVPYLQEFGPTQDEFEYYNNFLDLYGVNVGMIVDLSTKQFDYLQGTIVVYEGTITNEEYEEIHHQLQKGVRKIEEV